MDNLRLALLMIWGLLLAYFSLHLFSSAIDYLQSRDKYYADTINKLRLRLEVPPNLTVLLFLCLTIICSMHVIYFVKTFRGL